MDVNKKSFSRIVLTKLYIYICINNGPAMYSFSSSTLICYTDVCIYGVLFCVWVRFCCLCTCERTLFSLVFFLPHYHEIDENIITTHGLCCGSRFLHLFFFFSPFTTHEFRMFFLLIHCLRLH